MPFNVAVSTLAALTRPQWIQSTTPQVARTQFTTVVPFRYKTITMTAGITAGCAYLGHAHPSNLKDPFGTLETVNHLGVIDTDSSWESLGHDDMAAIYASYRVTSSKLAIRWKLKGGTGIDNVKFTLVCIPSVAVTVPVVTQWHNIMNHPLAVMSASHGARLDNKSAFMSYGLTHSPFIKMLTNPDDNGIEKWDRVLAFDVGGHTDQFVFYHYYLVADSADLALTEQSVLSGSMTLTQNTLMWKSAGNSNLMAAIATAFQPKDAAE